MIKYGPLLLSALFFIGCKDAPYGETPTAPEQTAYNFSGIAELGTPVSGTTVTAYKFADLKRGEKIAETISSPDGSFNLNLKTEYDGPILLAATGGLYRDLVTNEMTALKPAQELRSAITHIKMPEKTNINAWTTLAVARVLADRGFWDKSVAELKDIDRINVDFSQVSYFLTGKAPNFVNIRRQEFFDISKDSFKPDDPKVTLHLAHGGLSKLASDFSAKLAEEGIIVSVLDLVLALADDLSDRIFDGRNAKGSVVHIGNNRRINLNSYTMRKNFSEAIMLYAQRLHGSGKLSEDDKLYLQKPGTFVDSIARETQPELFPGAEAPKPVDKEPPTIQVHFAGDHKRERSFSFLSGNVSFDLETHDDTQVQEVRMLEPQLLGVKSGNSFGPIFVNHLPQAMHAASACGKKNELKAEIEKRELSELNIICACFEAVDVFGNASKELSCFQRPLLTSIVSFPTDKTILSSKSFSEGVKIKAHISGGLPVTECAWRIQNRLGSDVEEGILPSGKGVIEGTSCTIDDTLDGTKLFNGSYYLVVNAKDQAERILSDKQDGIYQSVVNFQVFKEPPAVEVLNPANNDYLATSFIPVFGTFKNANTISEIIIKYWGISEHNNALKGTENVAVDKSSDRWSLSVGSNLPEGEYSFDMLVKDIYGNEKRLPPMHITIDQKAPTLLGSSDGVPQTPYLQETINYRQRFVDEENNPHYVNEPLGEAAPINWQKAPRIYRWSTRFDDWRTAPVYTVMASDDGKLKEVRYKLNYKCATLEEADKKANKQSDRYDIWLTQSAASFDLNRDSEADGHTHKYCLSIWAIDQAGNATNHDVQFIWKVVVPPVTLDINSSRYRASHKEDDVMWINRMVWDAFRIGSPIELKRNLVIGHAILANPYAEPLSAKLELKKAMELELRGVKYQIPERSIDIRFFAYDLVKDQVGLERTLSDHSVVINANETIVAKFILAKNLPVSDINQPDYNFWKSLSIKVGFSKLKIDKPMVDGLRLITRDPYTGTSSNEFSVPWGENHHIRHKMPVQLGA